MYIFFKLCIKRFSFVFRLNRNENTGNVYVRTVFKYGVTLIEKKNEKKMKAVLFSYFLFCDEVQIKNQEANALSRRTKYLNIASRLLGKSESSDRSLFCMRELVLFFPFYMVCCFGCVRRCTASACVCNSRRVSFPCFPNLRNFYRHFD